MTAFESSVLADSGRTVSVPFPPIRSDTSSPFSTPCSFAHSAGSVIASVDGPSRWTFRVSIRDWYTFNNLNLHHVELI
jgi:hypothetical protein